MNIIFVCTGNTCRSPMAEGYLKSKNMPDLNISSRGFSAGESANEKSIAVMNEVGIDISNHISNSITDCDIKNTDKFICMTRQHKAFLQTLGTNNVIVLGDGIPDPFGSDINTYRSCRNKIFREIDTLIDNGFFNTVKISLATKDDIPFIAEIEKACFSTPWSENAIAESMYENTLFYIAKLDGVIAGYMGVSIICGEGYVTNVAVLPAFRRRGIGEAILNTVIKNHKNELEFISLEVRVSNVAAISLYKKLGFKTVGTRRRFYEHPTEDAHIMTKTFGD